MALAAVDSLPVQPDLLPSLPDLLTVAMTAEVLDVEPRTLEDWRYHSKGPAYVRDERTRRVYYLKTDLLAWIHAARHQPTN